MKSALSGAGRKRKGARRELQAVRQLEELGYLCTKAGGSLGAFDIIAIGHSHDRLIQVKSNRPPARKEYDLLRDLGRQYTQEWRTIEVWVYMDGNTTPQIAILGRPK